MTKENSARVRLVSGTLQSVSIAAAAACLMTACVGIYRMGSRPFSPESVAEAFEPIALPVYLCLGLIAVGFLLELILPVNTAKPKLKRQTALLLHRMSSRTDLNACSEELRTAVLAQRSRRVKHSRIRTVLLIVCSAAFLCYGANPANFHQTEINSSMARAMMVMIPCLAPCFCYAIYVARVNEASMDAEIALLKQAPAEARIQPAAANNGNRVRNVRIALVVLGVAFLVYGYITGGTVDVLTKAINICTECVGLG